jgi:signal transduction histidine kinase
VLDHARPAPGSSGPTPVGPVIARAMEFVRSRPEFARIRFDLDLADGGEAQVVANPVALGQVFLNLTLNACELQPGGGQVVVTTRVEGRAVVARVADRGPGVRMEDREKIFRPFASSKGSSGLGLFICREIVRQCAGSIDVQDRPGGGAVFTVRLPLA